MKRNAELEQAVLEMDIDISAIEYDYRVVSAVQSERRNQDQSFPNFPRYHCSRCGIELVIFAGHQPRIRVLPRFKASRASPKKPAPAKEVSGERYHCSHCKSTFQEMMMMSFRKAQDVPHSVCQHCGRVFSIEEGKVQVLPPNE